MSELSHGCCKSGKIKELHKLVRGANQAEAKKRRKSTCILYKISEVCKIYTENVHKTDHKERHKPYIIPRRLILLITQHVAWHEVRLSYSAILVTKYSHPSRHIATEFIQYKSKKKLDTHSSIC